jgi:hypothetical protein
MGADHQLLVLWLLWIGSLAATVIPVYPHLLLAER